MQNPEQEEGSIEWLRGKCVGLLKGASGAESPDHAACAKYAELLFKMLPRQDRDKKGLGDETLAQARAGARERNPKKE